MAGYAQSRGVPSPRLAVVGSGLLILVGGLMVLLGLWGDLGALFLVAFLVPIAVLMHGFWKETHPQARKMEMVQFNEDLALAGAALPFFGVQRRHRAHRHRPPVLIGRSTRHVVVAS